MQDHNYEDNNQNINQNSIIGTSSTFLDLKSEEEKSIVQETVFIKNPTLSPEFTQEADSTKFTEIENEVIDIDQNIDITYNEDLTNNSDTDSNNLEIIEKASEDSENTTENKSEIIVKDNKKKRKQSKIDENPSEKKRWYLNTQQREEEDHQIRSLIDMKCKLCDVIFHTFRDCQPHYKKVHNTTGFLECCGQRFKKRNNIIDHMQRHYNPSGVK